MLKKAEGYGYKKVGFILDRGYFGRENIQYMDECGYDFVIMVKGMSESVRRMILENKGEFAMTEKIMKIEGMACGHCSARVEKALNAIDGVSATVDLEAKTASITLTKPVDDQVLIKAVTDAGYEAAGLE